MREIFNTLETHLPESTSGSDIKIENKAYINTMKIVMAVQGNRSELSQINEGCFSTQFQDIQNWNMP